jgi:hypothetical protein
VKQIKIESALPDEPSAAQGREADEAVALAVRGGEVTAAVPAGTDEERVVSAASRIRGRVRLENERVLTFDIRGKIVLVEPEDPQRGDDDQDCEDDVEDPDHRLPPFTWPLSAAPPLDGVGTLPSASVLRRAGMARYRRAVRTTMMVQ